MNKITAIEKTIYNLENDVYGYNWMNVDACNCGILARTILGGKYPSQCGVFESQTRGVGAFSGEAYCLTTSLPLPLVFQELKDAGFTYQELFDLEYCANPNVCEAANIRIYNLCASRVGGTGHKTKKVLIKYLKSWLQILKEQTLQQPQYADIRKDLAVLPAEETSDIKKITV